MITEPQHSPGIDIASNDDGSRLVGRSPAFREMIRWVRRAATVRLPVLILGESGTGKEGVAREIHAHSPRASGVLIAVNCAALPDGLLESELFGAVRGAYTGADRDRPGMFRLANGGTLFLDEVGDMSLPMQAKLLRVLQDGVVRPVGSEQESRVDVRILAATHRDLGRLVSAGSFREDLFYRLAVVELRIPPLRERSDDIPLLADHLVHRLSREGGLVPARLTQDAIDRLRSHSWPGNIRELESVLARALLRGDGRDLTPAMLGLPADPDLDPARAPERLERVMIETALRECGGNVRAAAGRIGWSRQKVYRRMDALGIPRSPRRRS